MTMWTLKHIRRLYPSRGLRSFGNYENRIGNREVVGHGCNGMYVYKDDAHFPFPAIRFKEETPEIQELHEKEQGDWKSLSLEEKKALYRASFCQTFAEFQHPTGQWKFIVGLVLVGVSFTFWMQMFYFNFVKMPFPESLLPDNQLAQLQRMLDLKVNPIDGLASKYDYEKQTWK